jgi:haloalkane dehalogenase
MSDILRTPDHCFSALQDYPFSPNYLMIDDDHLGALRMHYLDVGPTDNPIILLLHGEPSWSYLYRKMIPLLVARGFRCIAPDLIGFGKSDKPVRKSDYSYRRHVDWMSDFLEKIDLCDATLFCQDWGGLIGLRLVAAFPDRFARLVISNTGLPEGIDGEFNRAFTNWRFFATYSPLFPIGAVLNKGSAKGVNAAARAAYDAPFPDRRYKAGARIFPRLVPTNPQDPGAIDNRAAWAVLEKYDRPVLTLFGDSDPVTLGWEKRFQVRIPGARGQPHAIIKNAGHFIQEDAPDELVNAITAFHSSTS